MRHVVVEYTKDDGTRAEIREEGDFMIGRYKTDHGPKLTLVDSSCNFKHLCDCPNSVSRLKINEEAPCHARFFWNNNILYVQDMGSMNGTYLNHCILRGWNKRRMSHPHPIVKDSMITIGGFDLIIRPVVKGKAPFTNGSGVDDFKGFEVSPEILNCGRPIQFIVQGDVVYGNADKKNVKKILRMDNVVNRGKVSLKDSDDDFDDEE